MQKNYLSPILRNYFQVPIALSDETIHDRNCNYQRNDLFCNGGFSDIYNTPEIMHVIICAYWGYGCHAGI